MMQAKGKKDSIVETAFRLFKENGFYATGVDAIMREAAVSKRTLYKYFPTKNELIVAVLEHYRAEYKRHIDELAGGEAGPRDKIRAIFFDAGTWFGDINFHGCLAVNAMAEFSGKDEAIESACLRFKHWEKGVLTDLCRTLGARQADQLAYKLFVLLEGMSAIALVDREESAVDITVLADQIIDLHMAGEE